MYEVWAGIKEPNTRQGNVNGTSSAESSRTERGQQEGEAYFLDFPEASSFLCLEGRDSSSPSPAAFRLTEGVNGGEVARGI